MTKIDLVLAALVVVGALWGIWTGAFGIVIHVIGCVLALAVPFLFAGPLARLLEEPLGAPYLVAYAFTAAALALVTYVVVRLLAMIPQRLIAKKQEGESISVLAMWNRVLGGFIGAAQMALMLWVALSTLTLLAGPFEAQTKQLGLPESTIYRATRKHNLLAALFADRLAALKAALGQEGRPPKTKKVDEAMAALRKDPRFMAIARDESIRRALASGDVTALARSGPLLSLVSDGDALRQLGTVVNAAREDLAQVGAK